MPDKKDLIEKKIVVPGNWSAFEKKLTLWRSNNRTLVFTNGCFDILHLGHVDYLSKAASLGDILIVGLNTDASVRTLKGAGRPINNEYARAALLASLFFVDAVVLFDQNTPYALIEMIQPDVLAKGSDYQVTDIVGYDIVRKKNGKIIAIDLLEGYSTSEIIRKLSDPHETNTR